MTAQERGFWTEDTLARMKTAFERGNSYREIGLLLACSRNAVSGQIHKMRKQGILPPAMEQPPRKPRPLHKRFKAPSLAKPPAFRPASTFTRGYRPRREPVATIAPPHTENAPLMLRTGCAWVTTDLPSPRAALYCNAQLDLPEGVHGAAYCPHHRERLYLVRVKA